MRPPAVGRYAACASVLKGALSVPAAPSEPDANDTKKLHDGPVTTGSALVAVLRSHGHTPREYSAPLFLPAAAVLGVNTSTAVEQCSGRSFSKSMAGLTLVSSAHPSQPPAVALAAPTSTSQPGQPRPPPAPPPSPMACQFARISAMLPSSACASGTNRCAGVACSGPLAHEQLALVSSGPESGATPATL